MLSICADISLQKDSNFTITDTEVTGMEKTDRVIEIGATKVLNGKIVAHFHSLVQPNFDYDKSVHQFLDIDEDDLKTAPPICDVLKAFKEFAGNDLLLIHNAPFDVHYLNSEFSFLNFEMNNKVIDLCTVVNSPRPKALRKYLANMGIAAPDRYSVRNTLIIIEEILSQIGIVSERLNEVDLGESEE